jgi:hypothetical protein
MAGLNQIAIVGYYLLWVSTYPFWAVWLVALTELAAVVAWGMYLRARGELVDSLRERAEQAEAAQHLLADQARQAERTRIAREMHDVLAHRVSLIALHVGGLEVRRDPGPDEVRETAGLIRSTARQALEELRAIIGVLRDGDGAGSKHRMPRSLPAGHRPAGRGVSPRRHERRTGHTGRDPGGGAGGAGPGHLPDRARGVHQREQARTGHGVLAENGGVGRAVAARPGIAHSAE